MPDNWGYVAAAYTLAAVVFGGYWRWLNRQEHELATLAGRDSAVRPDSLAGSRQPAPTAHHPRHEPASRPPAQP
jgi:hypothetical protein